jgi:serine/threonine protein kinase
MEGTDLEKLQEQIGGPMTMLDSLQFAMEICIVLRDYLHGHTTARGVPDAIIHRDIKPANIMRLNSGTSCMLDFGIARKENLSAGTQAKGTRAGSPVFQAPEMEKGGSGKPTARTDIYSLCATLYAMVSGEEDFPESRPDQLAGIRANIPNPDLQFILIKGTETDPAARWRNAEELFNRLARIYETLRPLPAHLAPPAPVVHHTAPVLAHQPTLTAPTLIPAPLPTPTIVQPAVHTPTQVVQPQQPKTRSMKVKWEKGKVAVYSQSEYQQKVVGKVVAGRPFMMKNDPVAGVMVTVTRIIDSGNPTNPVPATVDVITGSDGTFELQISDVTVPIEISKRTIYVQVEDSNGDAICHGDVDIKRPRQMGYKAAQAGAAVGNFFGGWVAAPWEWLKNTFSGFASRSVVVIGWIVAAVSAVLFIYGASTGKTWLWVIAPWGVANGMVAATIPKPETTLANGQKKKRLGTIRSLLYLFTAAAILLDYVFNFMPR